MTLPTIQPFDFPDWGSPGVFTTTTYNVVAVLGPPQVLAAVATGYYNHALVVFDGHGDGESYSVEIQYWTAGVSEGGSLLWTQTVIVAANHVVVVPMTSAGGFLQIQEFQATNYPHNALFTITLFAAWGTLTGWPGGIFAINDALPVTAMDDLVSIPLGCGPGTHALSVYTTATLWQVDLVVYQDPTNATTHTIADNATTAPWNIEFLAPASSWHLVFSNLDFTDCDVQLIVVRHPT